MTQNILLVKLSSMGDVVHSFPAITEAAKHGYRFDWVVEEAFVELAAQHPAVDRVIPFALRRWRKQPSSGFPALIQFVRELREEGYEQVLDAQGLLKSGFITRASGASIRMGLDRGSARESMSSVFYNRCAQVSWDLHAIDRLRTLFASSLGYAIDIAKPVLLDSSVATASEGPSATVLVHGTTWSSKELPELIWQGVIRRLVAAGHQVQLLSGSRFEHERAIRLAAQAAAPSVHAIEPGSLLSAVERIRAARLVIGVDSGLTHLAAVLGRPVVGLYGATSAVRTGARGPWATNLASGFACSPCLQRECQYGGTQPLLLGEPVVPACYAELSPELIMDAALGLLTKASSEKAHN